MQSLWNDHISPFFGWLGTKIIETTNFVDDKFIKPISKKIDEFPGWVDDGLNNIGTSIATWWMTNIQPKINWLGWWFQFGIPEWFQHGVDDIYIRVSTWWNTYIQPKIDWLGWLFQTGIPDWFQSGVDDIANKITNWWNTSVQPRIDNFNKFWTVDMPAWATTSWNSVGDTMRNWWDVHVQPKINDINKWWNDNKQWALDSWNNIGDTMRNWWNTSVQPKIDSINRWWEDNKRWASESWNNIGQSITNWWNNNVQPKIDAMNKWWNDLRGWAQYSWDRIGDMVDNWWNNRVSPNLDKIRNFFNDLFNGETWRRWADGAWGAVKGVLNTVTNGINIHIIDPLNNGARTVGLGNGDWLPRMAGFARGGILPGYTPYAQGDDRLVPMRSGEGVIVSEALAKNPYEKQRLLDLNHAALHGNMDDFYRKHEHGPGYAMGGVVGGIGGNIQGLDPEFFNRLGLWNNAAGGRYSVSVGYRSYEEQKRLYDLYKSGQRSILAAAPGTSWHQYGKAADLTPDTNSSDRGRAGSYGLDFPMSFEPWHIQLAGLTSADRQMGPSIFGNPLEYFKSIIKFPFENTRHLSGNILRKFAEGMIPSFIGAAAKKITEFFASSVGNLLNGGPALAYGGKFEPTVERWRPVVSQALGIMGLGQDLQDTTLRRLQQETDGNPNDINKVDRNWTEGHPSVGLMQVIRETYETYHHPNFNREPFAYGVSLDPLSNILASMRYALAFYGSLPNAYNRAGGYAGGGIVGEFLRDTGGILPTGQSLVNNNTGAAEWVFTPDQLRDTVADFVKTFTEPTYQFSSKASGLNGGVNVNNSGNVYNDIVLSVTANPGDNTEDIADRVIAKLNEASAGNLKGINGSNRVFARS